MKKGGKKWRKQQKETAKQKVNKKSQTTSVPFSKSVQEEHFCKHYEYDFNGTGDFGVRFNSMLKLKNGESYCYNCKAIFPTEKYDQMKRLMQYLNQNKNVLKDVNYVKELYQGIEPIRYRWIEQNKTEILETLYDWDVTDDVLISTIPVKSLESLDVQCLKTEPIGQVVMGIYKGCQIVLFEQEVYIVIDDETLVCLDDNNTIQIRYDKEESDSYYFKVSFKDGSESYVRLSNSRSLSSWSDCFKFYVRYTENSIVPLFSGYRLYSDNADDEFDDDDEF